VFGGIWRYRRPCCALADGYDRSMAERRVTRATARQLVLNSDAFGRKRLPFLASQPRLTEPEIEARLPFAAAHHAFWLDDETPRPISEALADATLGQIVAYCMKSRRSIVSSASRCSRPSITRRIGGPGSNGSRTRITTSTKTCSTGECRHTSTRTPRTSFSLRYSRAEAIQRERRPDDVARRWFGYTHVGQGEPLEKVIPRALAILVKSAAICKPALAG